MQIEEICRIEEGDSPVVAVSLHSGHAMRPPLGACTHLSESERLREEDPYTDWLAEVADTRMLLRQSRFEVDLNRPRERAVYQAPQDAWGLDLWKGALSSDAIADSLAEYDLFYANLAALLERLIARHARVVVLDIHSYNHRRLGPKAPFDDPMANPEINIGTGTMADRAPWVDVIGLVQKELSGAVIMGRHLDVRENVKFRGGHMAEWIHRTYPQNVACISLEFQKWYMNEWTGEADTATLGQMKGALGHLVEGLHALVGRSQIL
jgi:N-formylglutamate amidohydrolase